MSNKRAKANNYIKSKSNNNVNNNNSNNSNNTKILIVDDDFDIGNLIKMALQNQGYGIFSFTDPFLALEHFKINHKICNLVISDLRMPGMNGFEFVREARKINPKVKVLLMTAFEIDYKEFARVLPKPKIDGLIHKPISIRKLNGLIKSYMTTK